MKNIRDEGHINLWRIIVFFDGSVCLAFFIFVREFVVQNKVRPVTYLTVVVRYF